MGLLHSLGGVFNSPPEIIVWGEGDYSVFVFAVGTDQALWYTRLDGFTVTGGTWTPWQSLGGIVMSAPRAVRSAESSVDVFAAGAEGELLHWQFRDGAWTRWPLGPLPIQGAVALTPPVNDELHRNWESLGGIIISAPTATILGGDVPGIPGLILVFAVGSDHALWTRGFDGSWRPWASLGQTLSSSPHAVTFQDDFYVFARGTDSAIWYTMGGEWHSLGGSFSSAPYAVSTSQHLHVFAADSQSVLQHSSWDGRNSWSDWESLGGILMSQPTANAFQEDDLVHVYSLGADSAIWRRKRAGNSWTDWESLGGPFLSPPATVVRAPGVAPSRDLAALRTDHTVWYGTQFEP